MVDLLVGGEEAVNHGSKSAKVKAPADVEVFLRMAREGQELYRGILDHAHPSAPLVQ